MRHLNHQPKVRQHRRKKGLKYLISSIIHAKEGDAAILSFGVFISVS